MAKKIKPGSKLTRKGLRRRFNISPDKVAMSAAAMGTFLAIHRAEAAEKAKLAAEAANAAEKAELSEELTELLSKDLPPEQLAAEIERLMKELEEEQLAEASGEEGDAEQSAEAGEEGEASEVAEGEVVESMDGTSLAQAGNAGEVPAGVDARTTMSDGAGAAGADTASAATAGQGAAAGAMGELGAVTIGSMSIPVGVIAGASVAAAVAVASGGGGGGGAQLQTQLQTTTGLVVDGNVRDATIFYDRNGNGKLDAGEISTKTKADGTYEMTGDAALMTGKLVVLGDGFDILTGQKVGMMTAPEGFAFVSPLTTLVAAAGGDAASQNAMLKKLGLDGAGLGGKTPLEYLKTYDPVKAMTEGSPAEKALAEKAFTVSQQVFAVIQTASELQSKVSGGDGAALTNITTIAQTIAKSISDAPATTSSGDPVSTTSLINQAANKAVDAALSNTTVEVREALQSNVTRALSTVNEAIETKYNGLATTLTNAQANPNDATAITQLAEKIAIAAVSQNTLIAGIRAVDTTDATTVTNSQDTLLVAANKESLENLQNEVFVEAVKAKSDTATAQFLSLSSPSLPTATKFTIVDTQANILKALDPLDPAYNPTAFANAIGVVVSDPINLTTAQSLVTQYPKVTFRDTNVTYDGAATLSYELATTLIDAGYRFPSAANLTVTFDVNQLDDIADDAVFLASAGVKNLSVNGGTLGPGDGLSLYEIYSVVDAGLKFSAGNTIVVGVTDDDFATIASRAAEFVAANVDSLAASTGTKLSVALEPAITISNAGLSFAAGNTVSVLVDDAAADIALLASNAALLKAHGIDQIVLDGTGYTLTYAQAASIASAELPFIETHIIVTVDATDAAALPGAAFVAAGIDAVSPIGGSIALTSLANILGAGLDLHNGSQVQVTVTSADSALLAANADDLAAQGVTTLAAAAPAALTLASVLAARSEGLSFLPASEITVQVENASLSQLIDNLGLLTGAGIDHVGAPSGTLQLTIEQAQQLIQANLDFVGTEVTVLFDPDDPDALDAVSAVAAELKDAGVDYIAPTSSPLVLTLEQAESIFSVGFAFDPTVDVSLEVVSSELHSLLDPVRSDLLLSNNLDTLTVTDLPTPPAPAMPITGDLAGDLFDAGFDFAPGQNIALLITNADDFAAAVLHADAFVAGGLTSLTIMPAGMEALGAILALPNFAADIEALRTAGFTVESIDFDSPLIDDAEAVALATAGLDFGGPPNDVTLVVDTDDSSDATLQTTLKQLQGIGVTNVMMLAPGEYLQLDLGDTGTLTSGNLPSFDLSLHVGLNITPDQLSEITGVSGLASELALNGIDTLQADGEVLIQIADAEELLGDPASTDDNLYLSGDVSLEMSDADLAQVVDQAGDFASIGVQGLDVTENALTLEASDAAALIGAGLSFSAPEDFITLDVEADGSGTELNNSLKDLQKLGVDKVMLNGGALGDLQVALGAGGDPLALGGLPAFEQGLDVSLMLDGQGQLNEVLMASGLASELSDSGIDELDMADDTASINLDQASEITGTNLTFAAEDMVTLTVDQSSLSDAAAIAQDLADIGVDYVSANQDLTVGDLDAAALAGANLEFDPDYDVTLDADGTHLSSTLKDLQKLGVDKVMLNGGAEGDLHLGLGSGAALSAGSGVPEFEDGLDVSLNLLNQGELNEVLDSDGLAAILSLNNIDRLDMADNAATIDMDQAAQFEGTELSFATDDVVTLSIDEGSVSEAAARAQDLADIGVDFLSAGQALEIGDQDAAALGGAGLTFDPNYEVTLDADASGSGTHLSSSLKDLQKLGVDKVMLNGAGVGELSLGLGAGDALGAGGMPVFEDGLEVSLNLSDQSQLNEVLDASGLAGTLNASGIDQLDMADNSAIIDLDQASEFLGTDLTFSAEDIVTLTVDPDNVSDAASVAQDLANIGVDYLSGGDADLTIGTDAASSLVQAGIDFTADSQVELLVDGADGTHLSTSLKDLQKLGVDKVMLGGLAAEAGTLTVDAGTGVDWMGGLPQFSADDRITLSISGDDAETALNHVDALKDAGIDTLFVDGESPIHINLNEVGQLIGSDLQYVHGDLQFSADNNVTLDADDTEFNTALDHLTGMQGAGVDTIDMDANSATISDGIAQDLLQAGLQFAEDDNQIVLDASQSDGTHLSTSLKDMQKLGVDIVGGTAAASIAVDLGDGAFVAGGLPQFNDDLNVTLSVSTDQLGEVIGNAAALDGLGIDALRLHGTADELSSVDPLEAQAATVAELTLDTTGDDLLALLAGGIDPGELPSVGDLDVSRIDVIGASGTTGEFNIGLDAAEALIDSGLSFESMDNITLDITQGSSHGTALATEFDTMHKLGVDKINFNLDGAPGFQLDELPDFDDGLNVTLNVGDEDIGPVDATLASTLHDLGFDNFAFDEDLGDLGSLASVLDELSPVTNAGLGLGVNITGGNDQALDPALFTGMGVTPGDVPDLVAALTDSGVTQMNVKSDVAVTDELLNALTDAGMLNALPDANITLDATNSGDRLYTSLKEMADLDVDHVNASTSGNLYIDLGELGQGNALAEVKELLASLGADLGVEGLFTGADTPTLVLDLHTAESLSSGGVFNADIMAGLESIGIKEIGVLVGHNQHTDIVAQVDVPVEVKLIGQDVDPQLYDELYHPKA